ncbi:MAG: hypothetical protein CMO66_04545 [Verrucomicrobiales bacterium]|nr:hypothetical protein [Verrucomicrobiales bacterium]
MSGFHGYYEENHKRPQLGISRLLIKSRRHPVNFDGFGHEKGTRNGVPLVRLYWGENCFYLTESFSRALRRLR